MSDRPVSYFSEWRKTHLNHGHCGPFFDAKVHVWDVWRCPCGSRFYGEKETVASIGVFLGETRP